MAASEKATRLLSTSEVSRRTGWAIPKVRKLIEAGKLPAINTSPTDRPRWGIREEDLDAFLTPSNVPAPKAKPARRTRIDASVPKVF